MSAPLPRDEHARLGALARYGILDTPREPAFDDIARLAAFVCGVPLSVVQFVDAERQWPKALGGRDGPGTNTEAPREHSFCAHVVASGELLEVPDTLADARFRGNPMVQDTPPLRFYAGAPIVSADGHTLGTVCVVDHVPRQLTPEQREALAALGRQAARELELRLHVEMQEHEITVRAAAEAALVELVTERNQALEALAESEARNRRLAEATPDGVIIARDGRIIEANQAFCTMFGYSMEEVYGRSPLDIVSPEERDEVARRAEGSTEVTVRYRGVRRDGSSFPVEASLRSYALDGRVSRVGVLRDITERLEIDRLKNEFVSTVSHELRTPLTSIRGSLGLIEAGVVGEVSPRALELARIARSNADRLIRLINDILDLEKMEAGRVEMRIAPLDPAELVTTTLEGLQPVAEPRRLRLVGEAARQERVLGDRDRVVQVLTNLVSNAIKFSPDAGTVTVRTATGASGMLRFEVADNGPGIARELLPRLFRKFSQVDASDARARGGTGLGLAISRTLVEQLGGTIGVESEPGVRTMFWFELPLAPDESAHAVAGHADAPYRVLFIEDDEDLADVMSVLIASQGFEVVHAPTLAAAREQLAAAAPAVLLLDLSLPDGDGLAFLAEQRGAPVPLTVPAIVFTGHEQPGELEPGVHEWVCKPCEKRTLFGALRRAVRPPGAPRALVVDADAESRAVRTAQLAAWGIECEQAGDGSAALAIAGRWVPDLIVLDPALPTLDGFELVARLRRGAMRTTPLLVHASRELSPAERKQLVLGPSLHLVKTRVSEQELTHALQGLLAAFALPVGPG